jgi:hypothetical protein
MVPFIPKEKVKLRVIEGKILKRKFEPERGSNWRLDRNA